MKFKAKKKFISALGSFEKGVEYNNELDDYTFQNWVENGLISEVKTTPKKGVTDNDTK